MNKDPSVSLKLSPRVLASLMVMSWSCACLGREGTCHPSFQHCVFTEESGQLRGFDSANILLPASHTPSSVLPCISVTLTTALCHALICLHYFAMLPSYSLNLFFPPSSLLFSQPKLMIKKKQQSGEKRPNVCSN